MATPEETRRVIEAINDAVDVAVRHDAAFGSCAALNKLHGILQTRLVEAIQGCETAPNGKPEFVRPIVRALARIDIELTTRGE